MSGYDGKVRIGTKIDDSDLAGDLESLKSKLQNASAKLRDVMQGPVMAIKEIGRALQKVGQIVNEVEADWAAQEKAIAINKATLKATGAEAWTTTEAMQALADKLQKITGYANENILSMQNVLLGFKNIKGDNFDTAAAQILNMAKVMDMDLTSAAQAVGKALDDPIAGVDSLTRQGFRFSAAQKEVLKDLVNTGNMAEAQKIILDELTTTYGGAAAAANETSSAIKGKLGVAVDNLKERLGKFATDALAPSRKELTGLIEGLSKTFDTINANQNAPEILTRLATGLGAATAGVAAFVLVSQGHTIVTALAGAIQAVNVAIMANPYAAIVAGIATMIIAAAGAKKAEDEHTEAIRKQVEKTSEATDETKKLAEEYQNLYDKAKPTATEQERMVEVARLLHEKFPDLTTDTLNLAAANKSLAEKASDAAKAQAQLNLASYLAKIDPQIVEATRQFGVADERIKTLEGGGRVAGMSKADLPMLKATLEVYRKQIETLQAAREKAQNEAEGFGYIKPTVFGSSGGGSSTTSTAIPQGTRLKTLDEEYKARVALAESNGEDVAAIEKEWYDKRLAMLGDFVVEDAKKGIKLEDSLKSSFAGYAEEGSDDLRQLGKEIDATRLKVEKYKDVAGDTMFTPLDYGAANAVWNGEAAPELTAGSAQEWADDYLGKAAFQAIMQAVSEGLSASDTEEWVQEYLGKQAFETLQASASEALSASDAEEWVQTYLGDEAFRALQAAATEGLQAADTQEWIEDYLGDKAFKALQDAAEDGLQAADVAEWSEEYLGKNVFESLMAAADDSLQSAAVQEWCDDYLGKGAFDALQAAAEEGLQAADVEEWAADYLGKQVFDAMSEAATLGLQEADVAEWVADYLNEKKLANALDAEDMKIQAAKVAAWIADYKKNHGTVADGGDGWVAYDRYLEEMARKASFFGPIIESVKESWGKFSDKLKEDVGDWSGVFESARSALADSFAGAFETLGESIVSGTADWTNWGNSALKAFAGVLKALGYQLLAQAAYNVVLGITHLLMGDFAGAAAAAASALVAGTAAAAAFIGAGIVEGLAEDVVEANKFSDALADQNDALKKNRELWTLASKAAEAYASVLGKVKGAASDFYAGLQDVGTEITSALIDNLVNGFSEEDFLYAMEEYIRSSVIKAAVYTESLMASVAAIGAKISAAIANGATAEDFSDLAAELRSLWEAAADKADAVTAIIDEAFAGSYDVGSLSVQGDQYAKIHDSEMILPAGIAEEARSAGVVIGPAENLNNIGAAGMAAQRISLTLNLDGSITADGREIGRIAYKHFDEFAGAAYGY